MLLTEWFQCQGYGSQRPAADALEINPMYLCRVVGGHTRPSFDLAMAISIYTEGLVSVEEILFRDTAPPPGVSWSKAEAKEALLAAAGPVEPETEGEVGPEAELIDWDTL